MEKIRTFVAKQNITMLKRSSIALLERNSEGLDGYCSHPLRFIVVQSSYPLLVMADANNVAAYRFHFRPGFFALISIWHTIPDHGLRTTPNGFPKIQILQHSPGTKRSVHSILEPQPEPAALQGALHLRKLLRRTQQARSLVPGPGDPSGIYSISANDRSGGSPAFAHPD